VSVVKTVVSSFSFILLARADKGKVLSSPSQALMGINFYGYDYALKPVWQYESALVFSCWHEVQWPRPPNCGHTGSVTLLSSSIGLTRPEEVVPIVTAPSPSLALEHISIMHKSATEGSPIFLPQNFDAPVCTQGGRPEALTAESFLSLLSKHQPALEWHSDHAEHYVEYEVRLCVRWGGGGLHGA
jgi:hypothetical protein